LTEQAATGPVVTGQGQRAPLGGLEGALKRYRVMVLIVGTGLAVLCFVGIPLQLIGHNKWPWTAVVEIVGVAHGIFYMIYLITCLDLASRARFRVEQLLGMVCSGFLPLLAFYMERRVVRRVGAQLALGPDAPPAPAAVLWALLTGRRRHANPSNGPAPAARERGAVDGARVAAKLRLPPTPQASLRSTEGTPKDA
jgi:integral membrane protein